MLFALCLILEIINVYGIVPASNGIFTTNFLFSSFGETTNKEYRWNITNNVGTLNIRGNDYKGLAFYSQEWPGELRWVNVVGIANDGSNMCIIYFDFKYWENIIVNPFWEEDLFMTLSTTRITDNGIPASFTDKSPDNAKIPVSFNALSSYVPQKLVDTHITIDNNKDNNIYFNNNIGWHLYGQNNYTIYPYSFVNCTGCPKNCPECPPSPWYEIHHSAVNQKQDNVCFGIYYIYPYNKTYVQWNYTFCVPEIISPAYTFNSKWDIH